MERTNRSNNVTEEVFTKVVENFLKMMDGGVVTGPHRILKNNDVEKTAFSVREAGSSVGVTIYVDEYYKQYKAGRSWSDIFEDILASYKDGKEEVATIDMDKFKDFQAVKGDICFRLINREKNTRLLKEIPYRRYLDEFAVTYYIYIPEIGSVRIQNSLMELWDIDENTLYEYASKNMRKRFKRIVRPMSKVFDLIMERENYSLLAENTSDTEDAGFEIEMSKTDENVYIASNFMFNGGAAVLLYDDLLQTFAEQAGSDFYILPSSTDEVMFVVPPKPDDKDTPIVLLAALKDCNKNEEEPGKMLSEHIYRYYAEEGKVRIVRV